jgi:hypothetical protein
MCKSNAVSLIGIDPTKIAQERGLADLADLAMEAQLHQFARSEG